MEIYAEISSRLAEEIEKGYVIPVPDGVDVMKIGKRAYSFDCDETSRDELVDTLDSHGINWQDDREEEEIRKNIKEAKEEIKKKKKAIRDYYNEINQGGNYYT